MLRDVFYYGAKPNAHPREQFAKNLQEARQKSTTVDFWIINEFCDYTDFDWDFDFEFLPDEDVWAQDHNNVWPSVYQKDSGTWLCSKENSEIIIYRNDVEPLHRKNIKSECWHLLEEIDETKFDFGWHPDPTDPPYIYRWGCAYYPVEVQHVLEYKVPGATNVKYMNTIIPLKSQEDRWIIHTEIDRNKFDFSWRPDVREPAYNYVWGNKYEKPEIKPTIEYIMPGATETKYIPVPVDLLPQWERWQIVEDIEKSSFDFSWRPDPLEPAFIYVFGNHLYEGAIMPTLRYSMPGATEIKYIDHLRPKLAQKPELFEHLEDSFGIDYSWRPDPTSPPYIYAWGNQWNTPEDKVSIQYVVPGATEYKYMPERATRRPCKDNWVIPDYIEDDGFDYSWEPSPADPLYIYQFGTQHQKTGGPRYVTAGSSEVKYISLFKAKALPRPDNKCWVLPDNIDTEDFDFSWHPDDTDPPFIYQFGTQWALTGGPRYLIEGATEIKYIDHIIAKAKPDKTNWEIPSDIDEEAFDWSWHPYAEDDPCIYQIGTQHQKTGGPRYVTPGVLSTSPVKYIDTRIIKAHKLPNRKNFAVLNNYVIEEFDYSWHPDETEEPYIYLFGNNQYPAEVMPTIEYVVPGASQVKYINDFIAKLGVDTNNWEIPDGIDVSDFDFSWKPNPNDPPYIYQFGTQHQKTGGPRYVMVNAKEIKYVDHQKAIALPKPENFKIVGNIKVKDFDYSWHPDETEGLYVYTFGNNLYPADIMPTIEYLIEGATEHKYVYEVVAQLDTNMDNWDIPDNIDVSKFDFSWVPNPKDPPLIYQFGTQHQKTGGPRYVTPDSVNIKYMSEQTAIALPSSKHWQILEGLNVKDFDYSWHPDDTDEPYIYHFGNNLYPAEIMPTVEYRVAGAEQVKYVHGVVAKLGENKENWIIPENIDDTGFDYSWVPNPKDPPYIYEFGTQWQKTGGPRFIVENATEVKYIDLQKVKRLPSRDNWTIVNQIDEESFDWSWHPDATSPAYIYRFPTQWALSGGPVYTVEGAKEVKYVEDQVARALPNKDHWVFDPSLVDEDDFDYSWHPYVEDEPYIYQFGTQHQKTGGHKYMTPGVHKGSPIKYIDTRILKSKRLPNPDAKEWGVLNNYQIRDFDWSWHHDDTEEQFVYVFGNQFYDAVTCPTIEYRQQGASQVKYVYNIVAVLDASQDNWQVPKNIDVSKFDFSWIPNPYDPPFMYQFSTQWQKTGGPKYIVEGATDIKYISCSTVKALPTRENWTIPPNIDVSEFDFSWHPDDTSPPYIYHFATQWALTGGPIYKVENANETKYMEYPVARALPDKTNWEIPDDIAVDEFDFSWHPYVEDQPYVYIFGTQHQKTGGPRYITPGVIPTSPVKYIDTRILKAEKLPNKKNFAVLNNYVIEEFDYSWHPDETEEPYIYVFGNNQYPAEKMPTIEYIVPGATQIKYVNEITAKLGVDMTNWLIPDNIDVSNFDFSWKPDPNDPPFIYEFATQHQNNGGPRYVVPNSTDIKYVTSQNAIYLPDKSKWEIPENIDIENFDFSWHPDNTSPPFIYQFGTQWALTGGPRYVMDGATEIKYVDTITVKALPDKRNWEIPKDIAVDEFDFSWHPYAEDDPCIYQIGTQHQKTGGPRYITPGVIPTSPVKYIDTRIIKSRRLPDKSKFAILFNYKIKDFDYSWHPDETEEPYIYVFGNNQYPAEVMPTVEYNVPGATQIKYVSDVVAILDKDMINWEIPEDLDISEFDFSWKPNPNDPPYIYEFGTQWQKTGGPKYIVNGATEKKYVEGSKAKKLPCMDNWTIPPNIDVSDFDFSWHPDDTSPAYVYNFATQWALTGGPIYTVSGAQESKYMEYPIARALPDKTNWEIPDDIAVDEFDFSWHPYVEDQPYIYQFGTQHQKTGGPRYITPGVIPTSPIKYIDTRILKAKKLPNKKNFAILRNLKVIDFDYSWHPDDTEEPYIYIFGNTHHTAEQMPTVEYNVKGATQIKYIDNVKAKLAVDMSNWVIPEFIDVSEFDFSWQPGTYEPSLYIYEFGTQHQKTGGPRYQVTGAKGVKYVPTQKARALPRKDFWVIPNNVDTSWFDFSWHPDSTEDPYIYQFASETASTGGPTYVVPGAKEVKYIEGLLLKPQDQDSIFDEKQEIKTEIKSKLPRYYIETTLEDLINNHPDETFWALNKDIDYENFDFDWSPDKDKLNYIHAFGNSENINTQTYFVNSTLYNMGFQDINYVEDKKLEVKTILDMFFVDKGNKESKDRFEVLKERYGNRIQKTRYLNSWVDTINRCINRSDTKLCWILNSELDYSDFDFNFYPNPWQMNMVHVFGTQWSHWGTTFVVNRETFPQDTKYIKIIEHLSNLNFVKDRKAKATNNLYDMIVIDHGNKETLKTVDHLKSVSCDKSVITIPYDESYLKTIKNIINSISPRKEHHIWICSSICNYNDFDFSYIVDPFAKEHLHVFPSDRQKFGDTFFIDVNKAKEIINDLELLQQFNKVNYNNSLRSSRLDAPVIVSEGDSHVDSIQKEFDFPYAVFITEDNKDINIVDVEPMSLWTEETKNILITSTGGTRIIVPKEAKDYIEKELYDYPYIQKSNRLAQSQPLDIIFLSNGESCAEENFEHLLKITKGLKNKVVRIDGVNGRVQAYHAALEASNTPWAFTVFAKLKVSNKFDWGWQPDRLQMPKHYIFTAKNPLNNLEYGHQAMIAYNKKLTLANKGRGLDFTLDDPHESVYELSGVATFNTDPYSTWRTAFREAIKLKSDYTQISQDRLDIWLSKADGEFADFCLSGAKDGVEYYDQVNGDIDQLKLSYEWDWLKQYYDRKYK